MSSRITLYIATVIMVVFLHHPGVALLSLFFSGETLAVFPDLVPRAWAEEETPGTPESSPLLQEKDQPGEIIQAPKEPGPPVDEMGAPSKPQEPKPTTGFVEKMHDDITRRLLSTAIWLDSFFMDERAIQEINHSYIRARVDIFYEDKTTPSYKPTVSVRLALPQLQKKTHLVFSAEPKDTIQSSATPDVIKSERVVTGEERRFMTALDYFYLSTLKESVVVRTGALFSQGSPVLFMAPRYLLLVPIDPWAVRLTQELLWRTDTSWESDTTLDLERPLPRDFFFRTSASGVWTSKATGYLYYLSFTLRQPLDSTHALNYEWINSFQTRPVGDLTDIVFIVRYRHSFWRDWLFYEVAPQCRFPRDRNYDATPGILFKFEMFFGKNG